MNLTSRNNLGRINRTVLYLFQVGCRNNKAKFAGINKNETKLTCFQLSKNRKRETYALLFCLLIYPSHTHTKQANKENETKKWGLLNTSWQYLDNSSSKQPPFIHTLNESSKHDVSQATWSLIRYKKKGRSNGFSVTTLF